MKMLAIVKCPIEPFNSMVKKKQEDAEDTQTPIDFFMHEIVKLHQNQTREDVNVKS